MAPLQGLTLGQRQKYYNQLLTEAIANKTSDLPKINFEDDDVDNMMRIDIACHERNVDYILDVFKCEDMLYVSRAINKSTWLITDPQYAHIINPKYLHSQLFPEMNAKAVTKLMLRIRRYLRDEVRAKAFYKYVYETKQEAASHWLGNCSLEFIETIFVTPTPNSLPFYYYTSRADDIPLKLLKRLCIKSITVLHAFIVESNADLNKIHYIVSETMSFFLKNHKTAEEFLDTVESIHNCLSYMKINKKKTRILMKYFPRRIMNKFYQFRNSVDLPTFAKFIKTDEVRSFLLKNPGVCDLKYFEPLTHFLVKLPREETLDFLRTLFGVNFDHSPDLELSHGKKESDVEALFYAIDCRSINEFSNVYRWYRFAPFDIAFRDIKNFIGAEFSPTERHSMLIVLLTCASYDFEHVKTVLQYYHDKHMNEPYLHKITFLNSLLKQHDTFRFDDSTWNVLNVLFHSLEVYIESGNKVQDCIISIIVHNVLRDLPVHEIVEEKFEIDTLKDIKKKLNSQEQDKLFKYLYNLSVSKLNKHNTNSETGMQEAIRILKIIWNLVKDWNKTETHHRFPIDKIAEFVKINKEFHWIQMKKDCRKRRKTRRNRFRSYDMDKYEPSILSIYNMVKSHRILLFESSLVLHASEEACLNALKHDPGLLARYQTEINSLRCNDDISLKRFLNKLRIYWPDSLATEWTATSVEYLPNGTGHRALLRGIITLLPRGNLTDFIKMYIPSETKVHWSETTLIKLSIQKHIAKNMHIARPQLPAEVVLSYAKGDYLQYALLSLNTMFYNLRSSDIRQHINVLLNAPVSLQKHGIRLAFAKFKTDEIIITIRKVLKKTRNSSIRVMSFKLMFSLLCKETKVVSIKAIWEILSSIMDDRNQKENRIIHHTLRYVSDVPVIVIGDCYQKAFLFHKALPHLGNHDDTFDRLINCAPKIIEYLDSDFVENNLLGSFYNIIAKFKESRDEIYMKILSRYIFCSKDSIIKKYNKLLHPMILQCVSKLVNSKYGNKELLNGIRNLLKHMLNNIIHYVFVLKKYTIPIQILAHIRNALCEGSLSIKEYYVIIRNWEITVAFLKRLDTIMKESDETVHEKYPWIYRHNESCSLAGICAEFLAADEMRFFTSIYLLFRQVMLALFENFNIEDKDQLDSLYDMLSCKHVSVYLLVLSMLPDYNGSTHLEYLVESIKRKIYLYESEEVKMHYLENYNDRYSINNEHVSDEDDDTKNSQEMRDGDEDEIDSKEVRDIEQES